MFYQSAWWDDYKAFNDYFARLGKIVADSDEIADVLGIAKAVVAVRLHRAKGKLKEMSEQ